MGVGVQNSDISTPSTIKSLVVQLATFKTYPSPSNVHHQRV